jgi:predicted kinase
MTCVIVCGPPGAGKSTYVRQRIKPGDICVDVDELFQALTMNHGSREKPEGVLPFVLAARQSVIDLYARGLKLSGVLYIIMCGENNEARRLLASQCNATVIVLQVPAGECLRRMKEQGRNAQHMREVEPVVMKWHRLYERQDGEVLHEAGRAIGVDGWPA